MSMRTDDDAPTIPSLTTTIVTAYVSHHSIATTDFGRLIATVAQELGGLGQAVEPPGRPEPAVAVRRSVQHDRLVCLVCGKPFKSLRRHLQTAHGLTPAAYRAMFDLGRDYPMVAAASSEQRAAIARRSGLGQRRPMEPVAELEPVAEPVAVAEPVVEAEAQPAPGAGGPSKRAAAAQPGLKPVRGRRLAKPAPASAAADLAREPQPEAEPEPGAAAAPKRRPRAKTPPTPS